MPLLSREKINRVGDAALITLFLIMIWLPLLRMMTMPHASAQSAEEKRRLAQLPPLSFDRKGLAVFRGKFNSYFNDNFGGRQTLIRWQAIAKVKWLGVSPSPHVIVGKDGWLFFTGGGGLEGYYIRPPFAPEQLKRWREVFLARRDWLRARGIRYLVVFAPDKHTIYPEYLPDHLRRAISDVRLDQLIADLKEHTDLDVLDLRPAVLDAKQRRQVFLKTDTHWNGYGGFAAYRSLMAELTKSFPEITPLEEADCVSYVRDFSEGDLGDMLGIRGALHEESAGFWPRSFDYTMKELPRQLVVTERKNSKLPRMLMFRDSFASAILPFLSQHFSRLVYVMDVTHLFQRDMVKTEMPDIVVQETVERFLSDDPPEDPPETTAPSPIAQRQ